MFYIEISGNNIFFGKTNSVEKTNIETFNTEDELNNRLSNLTADQDNNFNIIYKDLVKIVKN